MSIIDKKPFINKVIETLTDEQKTTLKSLINGGGDGPISRSIIPFGNIPTILSVSDKGIKEVKLEVSKTSGQNIYLGYLVYNDSYCVLISYSGKKNQQLSLIELNLNEGNWSYQVRNCDLTILELRSELDDIAEGSDPNRIEVSNITNMSDEQLDFLKPGDLVIKVTGKLRHTYIVTYKEESKGICLSYFAAGYTETVSYDYTSGHWVYNSTDVVSGLESALKMPSDLDPAKSYTLKVVGGVLTAVEDE